MIQEKAQVYDYPFMGSNVRVIDSSIRKMVVSEDYSYTFDKRSGLFMRWGKTAKEDPAWCPIGPEILDLEISVNGCPQVGGKSCAFCYKGNTAGEPINMSFELFKHVIDLYPKVLTQVAFGITGVQTNPDFIKMMRYCREIGIVPNFTLTGADLTDELADEISEICGAVAVSCYESDPDMCFDTVEKFTSRGMDQVNIHVMLSVETLTNVVNTLSATKDDPRLEGMKAVVLLGLKPKGRAKAGFTPLDQDSFTRLVVWAIEEDMNLGFDSCSAPKFEEAVWHLDCSVEECEQLIMQSESCESTLFSSYVNVYGEVWPCSFSEDESGIRPVSLLNVQDFTRDVWWHEDQQSFREKLWASVGEEDECRHCPIYEV